LDGLDRFRSFSVPTLSDKQGLSGDPFSVLATRDGGIWLGTVSGLNHWDRGQVMVFRKRDGLPDDSIQTLFQDSPGQLWVSTNVGLGRFEPGRFVPVGGTTGTYVYSMAEDNRGSIWISSYQGVLHLVNGSVAEQIPWARLRRERPAAALLYDRSRGGLWLGFWDGALLYLSDGQVRASYSEAEGLGRGWVSALQLADDGAVWAATEGGLSRINDGRIATLSSKNGLPCDSVAWTIEDDDHFVWLYTACGLARVARAELDAWVANPKHTIQPSVFDASDGVRLHSIPYSGYSPHVTKAADGRLWFVAGDGVSVIDPRHLPVNKLPPPVHIEQIVSDRKLRWQNFSGTAASNLRLPALSRDLQIDYTALSLVAPEKVRFRYKLEGEDKDWQDAGNRRQAFYTNLAPRHYRFRVMASNNSGVWNETGDSLEFSIAPAYYQTTWFLTSCVAAFLALLWALHLYRLRQVAKEFHAGLEGRVGERMRIARELHDTLLQSFQGVLLKFSAVKYVMRSRPDEAEEVLERIIDQARAAITEGRDAVQGLRSSTVLTNDLARAIGTFGEGLAADLSSHPAAANGPQFRVQVEGKSRDLPPLVRDEVYHIACESLRNAFRHAQAKRIEVQLRYDPRQFRLRIVDNGKGIDPAVLSAGGRAGHHGLPGINERAGLAGGKLSVWSRLDSGTEIELTIPASIAYTTSTPERRSMASGKGTG
jgi:signal transduction histidine kinase